MNLFESFVLSSSQELPSACFDGFIPETLFLVLNQVFKLQGVQIKIGILGKMPLTGLSRGLEIGWVLKNSGNFQSNEPRNSVFLDKNGLDIKSQSWLPSP